MAKRVLQIIYGRINLCMYKYILYCPRRMYIVISQLYQQNKQNNCHRRWVPLAQPFEGGVNVFTICSMAGRLGGMNSQQRRIRSHV